MAVKKKEAAKAAEKKVEKKKGGKKELSADEKKAKREAMKERLKNRPEGQRPNSKQCDVIECGNGTMVKTMAMNIRKFGVLVTSIVLDKNGNVLSTSVTTVPGVSVKSKKGHGTLVPKVPGMGKKGRAADAEDAAEDEDDDDEDEE